MNYDALVVGSGIGGMESALKLGDMGYKVLVVEKEASIGGKMILLSKVFPTLDCASCISTPKMAATIHHPNVTVLTYSEIAGIEPDGMGRFTAKIHRKPTFVDPSLCTGCQLCEPVCNVAVPDQFNAGLVSRRAAYIPFPQAVPKKAVIDRLGTSPCTDGCPAGIKAHGYVALIRSGQPEKAFNLVLEATPLVGSLGRACYAPCESECTRGILEGTVPIRRLKRLVADTHYSAGTPLSIEPGAANGKRVAIVGSGPAGLTAAWQLRLKGYGVKIFEAANELGGMLRLGIPAYRLPNHVVDDDVANVTAIGVETATGVKVENLEELRAAGYDAVLLATGTHAPATIGVPGEQLMGVNDSLDFLRSAKIGPVPNVKGKRVVVVGGGNVAIDAARTALRLGAASVRQVCLESRPTMPAYDWEVDEALSEGVALHDSWGVSRFMGGTALTNVTLKRCSSVFDGDGRFNPQYDEKIVDDLPCDVVIVAVGMRPDTAAFERQLSLNANKTVAADPDTLQTRVPFVFAAGDLVSGPSMITTAVGHGRRAAFMIDRWLRGLPLDSAEFEPVLPPVQKTDVLARQRFHSRLNPVSASNGHAGAAAGFAEIEPALTMEEALYSTGRCLDCGVCSECHECVAACPANAINLDMKGQEDEVHVGTVIVSTGFKLFPADLKPEYGYGKFKNVITGMQMDRLLAPTRPYNTVLRPGDGKAPDRIAYIMCTGSRDQTVGNPLCSKICCMYSVKQNQLIMGALPLADVTVFYIDMRAVGKGYDEFYRQAASMGATFIKGRVGGIEEKDDGDLTLHYEDIETGGAAQADYDLVVLAVGVQPNGDAARLFAGGDLALDDYDYVDEPEEDLNPGRTAMPGVFVAGAASGAKDIPDSILHAGAAVAQAAAHLEALRKTERRDLSERVERPKYAEAQL